MPNFESPAAEAPRNLAEERVAYAESIEPHSEKDWQEKLSALNEGIFRIEDQMKTSNDAALKQRHEALVVRRAEWVMEKADTYNHGLGFDVSPTDPEHEKRLIEIEVAIRRGGMLEEETVEKLKFFVEALSLAGKLIEELSASKNPDPRILNEAKMLERMIKFMLGQDDEEAELDFAA